MIRNGSVSIPTTLEDIVQVIMKVTETCISKLIQNQADASEREKVARKFNGSNRLNMEVLRQYLVNKYIAREVIATTRRKIVIEITRNKSKELLIMSFTK